MAYSERVAVLEGQLKELANRRPVSPFESNVREQTISTLMPHMIGDLRAPQPQRPRLPGIGVVLAHEQEQAFEPTLYQQGSLPEQGTDQPGLGSPQAQHARRNNHFVEGASYPQAAAYSNHSVAQSPIHSHSNIPQQAPSIPPQTTTSNQLPTVKCVPSQHFSTANHERARKRRRLRTLLPKTAGPMRERLGVDASTDKNTASRNVSPTSRAATPPNLNSLSFIHQPHSTETHGPLWVNPDDYPAITPRRDAVTMRREKPTTTTCQDALTMLREMPATMTRGMPVTMPQEMPVTMPRGVPANEPQAMPFAMSRTMSVSMPQAMPQRTSITLPRPSLSYAMPESMSFSVPRAMPMPGYRATPMVDNRAMPYFQTLTRDANRHSTDTFCVQPTRINPFVQKISNPYAASTMARLAPTPLARPDSALSAIRGARSSDPFLYQSFDIRNPWHG